MNTTETVNLTGVIVEHDLSDEEMKDLIGQDTSRWLEKYGLVTMTIRENHDHDLIKVEVKLLRFNLIPDSWNNKFSYVGQVVSGPEGSVDRALHGELHGFVVPGSTKILGFATAH